jgi:putative AbiEi antitoxin of type IV toxin-antitoxin system
MPLCHLPQPFTRAECLASGVTSSQLNRAVGRGEVTRIVSGLYALTSRWDAREPWHRHLDIAEAAARTTPDAIVSHASAAALLGLPMPPRPPTRATMTLLDDRRTSEGDSWRRFHRGHTPPEHVVIDHGRPHLIHSRTVIDCIRDMRPGDALAVLDAALGAGLVSGSELMEMRRHQRRWPGIAAADSILRLGDGRRETWLESSSAWAMARLELPPGIPQVVVCDAAGRFIGRVDVLWPELGLVGEADGKAKYMMGANPARLPDEELVSRAMRAQEIREEGLHGVGLQVFRWGPEQLADLVELHARFLTAVAVAAPQAVTAQLSCSCCRAPLADCGSPTRIAGLRAA